MLEMANAQHTLKAWKTIITASMIQMKMEFWQKMHVLSVANAPKMTRQVETSQMTKDFRWCEPYFDGSGGRPKAAGLADGLSGQLFCLNSQIFNYFFFTVIEISNLK